MSSWDEGRAALASGEWERAAASLEAARAENEDPEVLDALGRAYWWLGQPDRALDLRERAYNAFKRDDPARASRIALWLSNEYDAIHANEAAANGWLARAARLLDGAPQSAAHGWLALARAARTPRTTEVERHAREALDAAREHGDPDLEIRSLARLGLSLVDTGRGAEGVACFDEAMAAATGGEATALETIGETCCDMFAALELLGDVMRMKQWNDVVMEFMGRHRYGPLVAFCGACCGEMFAVSGDIPAAERELTSTLKTLEETGQRSRCVHPAAKLAELRVLQGRYEEAERLLSGYEGLPESVRAQAALAAARGEYAVAAALVERRLNAIGEDSLLSAPLLVQLVEILTARGDLGGAREGVARLAALATATGELRVVAFSERATGRIELESGAEQAAVPHLERALERFVKLNMPIEAARTRVLLSRAAVDPALAAAEAQAALAAFEQAGAARDADEAAALVRALLGSGRTGPKGYGTLSKREEEVLALLAEGLTNAEIAARLFISVKTAGNHVSNILMRLGLRSRAEAAAFALRRSSAAPPARAGGG